jgi:hypothetical protein
LKTWINGDTAAWVGQLVFDHRIYRTTNGNLLALALAPASLAKKPDKYLPSSVDFWLVSLASVYIHQTDNLNQQRKFVSSSSRVSYLSTGWPRLVQATATHRNHKPLNETVGDFQHGCFKF